MSYTMGQSDCLRCAQTWMRCRLREYGIAYASKVREKRPNGEVGVMHACGHDLHMTCSWDSEDECGNQR